MDDKSLNMRLPEAFGDRIAFLRKLKGMTQSQLAGSLGISAQAVSKWESGLSCPDIMMLVPLADIFGVSTDILLGGGVMSQEELSAVENKDGKTEETAVQEDAAQQDKNPADTFISDDDIFGGSTAPEWKIDEAAEEIEKAAEAAESKEDKNFEKESDREFRSEARVHRSGEMIHSLYVDLAAVEAIIKEGDEFALDLSGYPNGDCREEVRDGVWRIREKGYKGVFMGLGSLFTERRIVIIIPRGYHFEKVKIKVGAGRLVGQGINTNVSDLDLGAGEVVFAGFHSGPAKIKCGMGKIMLEGSMWGKSRLDCGMGEIAASLSVPDDYGYRVKVGMGEVRIGDDTFGGMGGNYKKNQNADNFFDVNCSMGAIKVVFAD